MSDASILNQKLVDQLKRDGHIRSAPVEAVFRAVPRHLFLPDTPLEQVYSDQAIITKRGEAGAPISSSSQPAIMAIMLEQLDLQRGQRVLEIGAGTGYNAALIAHIVGAVGKVVAIDIDAEIVENAREHLRAAGVENVRVICGDGGLGYADTAPYDRIILTVGAWDIVPAWIEQLQAGGRLVLPLALRGGVQKSIAFEKRDDYLASLSVRDCGFMTLRGAFAATQNAVQLRPDPALRLTVDDSVLVNSDTLYRLLTEGGKDWNTGIELTGREIFGGLNLWLALKEATYCRLEAIGEMAKRGLVPRLFGGMDKYCATNGVLGDASLSVLVRPPDHGEEDGENSTRFELFVRQFGADDALAQRLVSQIRAWDAAGRPSSERLRVRAYPREATPALLNPEFMIEKTWTRLAIEWVQE